MGEKIVVDFICEGMTRLEDGSIRDSYFNIIMDRAPYTNVLVNIILGKRG